jgi:RND superfamily putative drug exporter
MSNSRPGTDDIAGPVRHARQVPIPPAAGETRLGAVARIARWCVDHRGRALIAWVVLLVAVLALSGATGARHTNEFSLPGTQTQRAEDLLNRDFPAQSGDLDQIVFHALSGRMTDQANRARIDRMLAAMDRLPDVAAVTNPSGAGGGRAISRDGRIAFATVAFDKPLTALPRAAIERVVSTAEQARGTGLQVELGGQAIESVQSSSSTGASALGILAAVIVLLVAFGSFIAMGLPIATALLGFGSAVGVITLASHVLALPDYATELAAMIGIGVGIDYSLFVVTRFRENHRRGQDVRTATLVAMDTAGRAVLFAGCTVIIALLGMLLLGVSFLSGLAVASSIAVLFTMLAALTALPALLSRVGGRLGRRRRPRPRASAMSEPPVARAGFWVRWARFVTRHPWPAAVAGLAIMLVIAVPALSLRMGLSDAGNDPANTTTRKAYDLLAEGFGQGFNGPLQVVVQLPRQNDSAALARISSSLRKASGVVDVSPPRVSPGGTTAVFEVDPGTAPQSAATTDLVRTLRDTVLPPVAHGTGTTILVGGETAGGIDFAHVLSSKLPLFIAVVVVLAALLLLVVFRSLVIPVQAAVMNLLTIGASLGVVVAVFQHGWFGQASGPIDAWVPVLLFAIVFGLSMDYEVFLVSRIHEEWLRRREPSRAVVDGLATTGRVVTAAAMIMICVFLAFVLLPERQIKMFGLSLASAVFLDAFVVRCLLLPALLAILGRRTWWLPVGLRSRLPHLALDPAASPGPASPSEAV